MAAANSNAPNQNNTNKSTKKFTNTANMEGNTINNINQQPNNTINYANALKNNQKKYPNKDQAVILRGAEGLLTDDYVLEVGNIIGPDKILFYSKKANNRIHIYFRNNQIAEQFTQKYKTINVKGYLIHVRPYLSTNKRLIISNVDPFIPDEIIEEELKKIGMELTSEIDFLRAGMKQDGYTHCFGFRRHVYIKNNENLTVPDSITFKYDNDELRIYLTDENHFCIYCKKHGHLEEKCKFKQTQTNKTINNDNKNTILEPPVLTIECRENQHIKSIEANPLTENSPNKHQPIENKQKTDPADNTITIDDTPSSIIDCGTQPLKNPATTQENPKRPAPSSSIGSLTH